MRLQKAHRHIQDDRDGGPQDEGHDQIEEAGKGSRDRSDVLQAEVKQDADRSDLDQPLGDQVSFFRGKIHVHFSFDEA